MTAQTLRSLRSSVLALALALLPAACGSADDSTSTSAHPLTCQIGQFRLQGTLGDQSVDITESSAGGGLTQTDSGELQIGAESLDPAAPVPTKVHLTWAHGIVDGSSTDASGTLEMASGSFAGQALCMGQGTRVSILTGDAGVAFHLAGLASGGSCATPVAGALDGCWR